MHFCSICVTWNEFFYYFFFILHNTFLPISDKPPINLFWFPFSNSYKRPALQSDINSCIFVKTLADRILKPLTGIGHTRIVTASSKGEPDHYSFITRTVQLILVVADFQNPLKLFGRLAQMKRFLSAACRMHHHRNNNRNHVLCFGWNQNEMIIFNVLRKKNRNRKKGKSRDLGVNYLYVSVMGFCKMLVLMTLSVMDGFGK